MPVGARGAKANASLIRSRQDISESDRIVDHKESDPSPVQETSKRTRFASVADSSQAGNPPSSQSESDTTVTTTTATTAQARRKVSAESIEQARS